MVRPDSVLGSWKTVRLDTAQAVLDMPPGELDFRPAADLMTFREIALHTLNAGRALAGFLADGVTDLATPGFRDDMKRYFATLPSEAGPEAIAEALKESIDQDCARLGGMPGDFWNGMMRRFDGVEVTRLEMLQFTKEHELTHRSQMFLYLRLKGVVPPTTRRKMARK